MRPVDALVEEPRALRPMPVSHQPARDTTACTHQVFTKPVQPRNLLEVGDSRERPDVLCFQQCVGFEGEERVPADVEIGWYGPGEELANVLVSLELFLRRTNERHTICVRAYAFESGSRSCGPP